MLALSLSDRFCCFGIFVFVFNRFLFFRFSFVFVFIIFFVFVLVFVNENHTGIYACPKNSSRTALTVFYTRLKIILSDLSSVTRLRWRLWSSNELLSTFIHFIHASVSVISFSNLSQHILPIDTTPTSIVMDSGTFLRIFEHLLFTTSGRIQLCKMKINEPICARITCHVEEI